MPAIVVEPPVSAMNMHSPSLGNLPRMQQYNPNGIDSIRQHDQSPVSATSGAETVRVQSELFLDPRLEQSESQASSNGNPGKPTAPQKCELCNETSSSGWKRDSQGKLVCNACGEYLQYFIEPYDFATSFPIIII
jgi:GATA-binding protein, other eukaryote